MLPVSTRKYLQLDIIADLNLIISISGTNPMSRCYKPYKKDS